jgi:hypothetical protein
VYDPFPLPAGPSLSHAHRAWFRLPMPPVDFDMFSGTEVGDLLLYTPVLLRLPALHRLPCSTRTCRQTHASATSSTIPPPSPLGSHSRGHIRRLPTHAACLLGPGALVAAGSQRHRHIHTSGAPRHSVSACARSIKGAGTRALNTNAGRRMRGNVGCQAARPTPHRHTVRPSPVVTRIF